MGLKEVIIKNFALINYIDIEFSPGLNVITGETGAGKTLILKAIEFALGARLDGKYIREEKRGSVTLLVDMPDTLIEKLGIEPEEETIVKREIDPHGRTRMYINGELIPQSKAREVFSELFEFHGQFSNTALFTKRYMTELYDSFLGKEVLELKEEMKSKLSKIKKLKRELEELSEEDFNEEIAYIEEQLREFSSLGLTDKTEDELKEEEKLLKNAKEVVEGLAFSYDLLYENDTSVTSLLALVEKELRKISSYSKKIEEITEKIDSFIIEVEETSREIYDLKEGLEVDETRLNEIEELLSKIYLLKRKYRVKDVIGIISYIKSLRDRLSALLEKKRKADNIKQEIKVLGNQIGELAEKLTEERIKRRGEIEKKVEEDIRELGIPYAKFSITFTENKKGEKVNTTKGISYVTESGREEVEFLFSANPDKLPHPLSKTASGGELSRVMLAIRSVLSHEGVKKKILLFDEIDQGVGERLGDTVGEKLKRLSFVHQVVAVTHLSQIAKKADNHISVIKSFSEGKTVISAKILQKEERAKELMRMLGGEEHISTLRRG